MYLVAGYVSVKDTVFCENQATTAGAVWSRNLDLRSSVVVRNRASDSVGGVHVQEAGLQYGIEFNHFVGNEASNRAAFHIENGRFEHSIVVGNAVSSPSGLVFEGAGLATREAPSVVWDNVGLLDERLSLIEADPELSPWTSCDSLLLPGWYGAARDTASDREPPDPDGTPSDVGAYAQGGMDASLWLDADGDGVPDLYDCARVDPDIHPGAVDEPYDGIDADCRGDDDYDADSDGARPAEHGGLDCDDLDTLRAPDRPEMPDNGIDDDCDGWVDGTARLGPVRCSTGAVSGWFGPLVAWRRR